REIPPVIHRRILRRTRTTCNALALAMRGVDAGVAHRATDETRKALLTRLAFGVVERAERGRRDVVGRSRIRETGVDTLACRDCVELADLVRRRLLRTRRAERAQVVGGLETTL